MSFENLEEIFQFYNIDKFYRNKCYKCIDKFNEKKFAQILKELYEDDFNVLRKYWSIKNVDTMFWEGVDPFITNLTILCGYKYHLENIKKYNFDSKQVEIQKKRIKECFINDLVKRNYNGVRISQMLWSIYFSRGRLIEIGRLQYEYQDNETIKIHIPSGSKLIYDEVIESIKMSKGPIQRYYGITTFNYVCNSWLLSNQIYNIINQDSNIAKFRNLFIVSDGENCIDDILNFVYGIKTCNDYNLLSEETSLQRNLKQALLDGQIFYLGLGRLNLN